MRDESWTRGDAAAVQAGARDRLIDEHLGHREEVVLGQEQGLVQGHNDDLLGWGEGRMETMEGWERSALEVAPENRTLV